MNNSHGRFVWYELMTTDMEAARTFYADVVGWGTRDASMPGLGYNQFMAGTIPVAGVATMPEEAKRAGATAHWIGYVGVDDIDAAVDRIVALGGTVRFPPTNFADISRFAIVADSQMATLALVTRFKSQEEDRPEQGTPGHVDWHELLAADWEKAIAFYCKLFGWQKAESHVGMMGTYQQFSIGGEALGGMFTKPPTLPVPFWLYYFNVDDIEAAATRVEAGGGTILYGPTTVPGGASVVHCLDPHGAAFALIDRRRKAIGYFVSRNPPT